VCPRPSRKGWEAIAAHEATLPAKARRLLKLYEEHMAVSYSKATAHGYRRFVGVFLLWLSARGVDFWNARSSDLEAYQAHLYALRKPDGKPYSIGSQINHLKALRTLYGLLYRRGYALTDAAAPLQIPRQERRLPRVILTRAEARKIIEVPGTKTPEGLRDRAVLETLYATGIRAGELMNLSIEDVDTEDRMLRVVLGKGRKDRTVPLTRTAAEAIEAYLVKGRPALLGGANSPTLFLTVTGVKMNTGPLNVMVREWAAEAGVKKRVTCHTFRHSVATHLLKGHADIRHIQAFLGHESLSTTEIYTRVEVSDLKKVIERAHPRGR
jgi:integrase/recombinase XerD